MEITNSFCGYSLDSFDIDSPFEACIKLEETYKANGDIELNKENWDYVLTTLGEFKRTALENYSIILKRMYKAMLLYTYSANHRTTMSQLMLNGIFLGDALLIFGCDDGIKQLIDEEKIYSDAVEELTFQLKMVEESPITLSKEIPDYMRLDYISSETVGDWVFDYFPVGGRNTYELFKADRRESESD